MSSELINFHLIPKKYSGDRQTNFKLLHGNEINNGTQRKRRPLQQRKIDKNQSILSEVIAK